MTRIRSRAVPKPKPDVIVRRERRQDLAQTIRAVRVAVWRRDAGRCRACHRRRGDHMHHLKYRSRGGRWTTANCLLLCRACHQDVHAQILRIRGTDANRANAVMFERRQWW
jgi:5-methylcytosine-specific restriction endonuclease McrA